MASAATTAPATASPRNQPRSYRGCQSTTGTRRQRPLVTASVRSLMPGPRVHRPDAKATERGSRARPGQGARSRSFRSRSRDFRPCPSGAARSRLEVRTVRGWWNEMNRQTKRILVGYDGSTQATAAVEWAAIEAARRVRPLMVLYVVDYGRFAVGGGGNGAGVGYASYLADDSAKRLV